MPLQDHPPQEDERSAPRYEKIRKTLREAIVQCTAPAGLVLVEGPLAQLFGTSRVPVRQALNLLHEERLISRFEGRGYLVNPRGEALQPLRIPLTREQLGLHGDDELIDNRPLGERVYNELAACVAQFMVFGHYRLDEQAAAQQFNVSRSVVREALIRLRDRGLVEKEPYSPWFAGPLTAQAVSEDYEVRALLEPEALRQSALELRQDSLKAMLKRIVQAQEAGATAARDAMELIEQDLHVECLAGLRNRRMTALIRHCQIPMGIGRIIHQTLRTSTDEAMLAEHRLIIESLLYSNLESAVLSLRDHLLRARERTLQRLKVLSVLPEPQLPSYLIRLS